jgi:MFS family permease
MPNETLRVAHSAESEVQWTPVSLTVVGLCFILNMLDGADVTIMSFIAPQLATQWSVSPERLGIIFSASLLGMALGCLLIAPLADRYGRRTLIMGSLALVSVAMIGSGFVTTVSALIVMRLLVGIGVGTIGVSMTAMAAEFAPPAQANFAVGAVQAGWPLAAIMTAFAAAGLLPYYHWQAMLMGIGAMSTVLLVVVVAALPESRAFLAARARDTQSGSRATIRVSMLFADGRARTSILLWTAVTFGYFVLYFVISWIPKLANQAGLPLNQAIYAGAGYNVGSFIGSSLIGWLAARYRINRVIMFFFIAGAGAMLVFGGVKLPLVATLGFAVLIGIFVNGGFNGFWGFSAMLYPPEMRGAGIGWAMGLGRVGAVLGPSVGGYLVGAKYPISAIFAIYTVPLIIAATLCQLIRLTPKADGRRA